MNDILRFLGNNYASIDKFALLIIFIALLLAGLAIWFLSHKQWRWPLKLLFITLAALLFIAIASTVYFVKSNVNDLAIPNGYKKQKVNFLSDDYSLSGELLLPENKTRVPAVIFISGSEISSYHTNYSRLANEVITQQFSELGYAILYYDKRGVGYSEGDWMECSFKDFANDSYAAIEFLKSIKEIDSERIGVVGHSQGGWIAQLVASQHQDIWFVISLAGPTVQVKEQIRDDEIIGLICDGKDYVSANKQASELMADLDLNSQKAKKGRYHHYALIKDYQPDSALRAIRQPALLMFGTNDRLVLARKNMERLKGIFNDSIPSNFTIKEIPGVGHSFREMDFCYLGSQKKLSYSPLFTDFLKSWASELVEH